MTSKDELAPIATSNGTDANVAPLYAHLIDKLTGDCLECLTVPARFTRRAAGPASPEQYRFLAGNAADGLVRQPGGHRAVLEVFVGRPVSSSNPPGIGLASKWMRCLRSARSRWMGRR